MASAGGTARILRSGPLRRMKVLEYSGLSVASGNFPKGSNVRIKTAGKKTRR